LCTRIVKHKTVKLKNATTEGKQNKEILI